MSLDLSKGRIHAFVGPNGHGKTNLLEAIFLLAISKSFRTNENLDLVGFNEDFCSLKSEVQLSPKRKASLEMIVTKSPSKKILKSNGVQKKAAEYIGQFHAVFFSPDDMGLIHLSPSIRRRYLDLLVSQLDSTYMSILMKYQQVVKQRNSLLKNIVEGISKESELSFWDREMAQLGFDIVSRRLLVLDDLSKRAKGFYKLVSADQDDLEIHYLPTVTASNADEFEASLRSARRRDLIFGSSHLGPHRDDLRFLCNDKDMESFASRGESRSLILTLKYAEVELLKDKHGEYPVLLLDDVFSELDEKRQRILFNLIQHTQTFITTTHVEFLEVLEGDKLIYKVKDGEVVPSK